MGVLHWLSISIMLLITIIISLVLVICKVYRQLYEITKERNGMLYYLKHLTKEVEELKAKHNNSI